MGCYFLIVQVFTSRQTEVTIGLTLMVQILPKPSNGRKQEEPGLHASKRAPYGSHTANSRNTQRKATLLQHVR